MFEVIFVTLAIFGACVLGLFISKAIVDAFTQYRLFKRNRKMATEYKEASRRG